MRPRRSSTSRWCRWTRDKIVAIELVISGAGQKSTGTLEIDAKGFPVKLDVAFPFGNVAITRK